MGERLKIKTVFTGVQDALYHWRDDCNYDVYVARNLVHVETVDDRFFLMPAMRGYSDVERLDYQIATDYQEDLFGMKDVYPDAEEFAAKVRARGTIDPQFWVHYEPDTRTTEERFNDEYEREQFERMGWAA